jgi:serine/threonine-protein kinase
VLGKKIGNYLIREKLIEDARAGLYLAEHEQLNRQISVRVLHGTPSSQPEAIELFKAGARQASQIRSPHVAGVLDVGELESGAPYYTSEWVRGRSLADLLAKEPRLPLARAAAIARGIANGLAATHAAGMVHGDLRPEEVVLAPEGESGDLDFAKLRGPRATDASSRTGFRYWSPERNCGEELSAASDVYALGAIVYQMLTGQVPFVADDERALLRAHLTREPASLRTIDSEIPESVDAAVLRALNRNPAVRFTNPTQLAEALALAQLGTQSATPAMVATVVSPAPIAVVSATPAPELAAPAPVITPPPATPSEELFFSDAPAVATHDEEEYEAPPKRRSPWLIIGAAAVLGLGAIGFFVWRSTSHATTEESAPVAATPVAPAPAPAPVAAAPAIAPAAAPAAHKIHITVHTTPADAKLFVDLDVVPNPYVVDAAADDWSHMLEASAPGYASKSLSTRFDHDATIELVLTPKHEHHAAATPRPAAPAKAATPRPAAEHKASSAALLTDYPQ